MQALRCLIYDNEVHSLPAWNNHENVAMGLLRYWRAFLRYLSQKTIKTFVLSLLVISHLHGRYSSVTDPHSINTTNFRIKNHVMLNIPLQ